MKKVWVGSTAVHPVPCGNRQQRVESGRPDWQAQNAKNPASTTPIVSSVVATGRLMNGAAGFTLAGLQSGLIAAEAAADQVAEATQHRVTRLSFP